jgi:two-component system sensor histidine kinase KdpD
VRPGLHFFFAICNLQSEICNPREAAMPNHDDRPPPEKFLSLIRQQQRGRLKIYLGFAAGVGKTYEMLQEGHKLKKQGVDVVIGFVETHGRAETLALVGDLEQVPRRRIEYRGVMLEEMDLDAVLARRPQVALVDELAHTNAPGSRHGKRYQDVEELLRHGIHVISTMNVQHIESVHDMVERFTGVRVKERVPDYVLGLADQVVNVDVSAEDLRERLQSGKVYAMSRVPDALDNFFRHDNLTRLRELALEEIHHLLDRRRAQEAEDAPPATERVMVCLSSRGPRPDVLLRKGARLADRLHAPWYAVYIRTPSEDPTRIDAAVQRQVADSLTLARQLGATTFPITGPDFPSAVAAFVREYGITHIILGRTLRPWYRRWFGQSPLDRLLQAVPGVDVIVVDTK